MKLLTIGLTDYLNRNFFKERFDYLEENFFYTQLKCGI